MGKAPNTCFHNGIDKNETQEKYPSAKLYPKGSSPPEHCGTVQMGYRKILGGFGAELFKFSAFLYGLVLKNDITFSKH